MIRANTALRLVPRYTRRVDIFPAADWHAAALAPRLRQADIDEIDAGTGLESLSALSISLAVSHESWCGMVDGEVACLFGLGAGSYVLGIGRPWLLGSALVEENAIAFLRRNRAMVRRWASIFPFLENWVDARHTASIRWLSWLGFTIHEPAPHGRKGMPFHRFTMGAS